MLDASAIMCGCLDEVEFGTGYTPGSVLAEIKSEHARDAVQKYSYKIKERNPSPACIEEAVAAAQTLGFSGLSRADIEVAALALSLKKEWEAAKKEEATVGPWQGGVLSSWPETVPVPSDGLHDDEQGGIIWPERKEKRGRSKEKKQGAKTKRQKECGASALLKNSFDSEPLSALAGEPPVCLTNDMTLLHLLARLGIRTEISAEDRELREQQTFVQRCYACEEVYEGTDKVEFCRKCGYPTITRVSCSKTEQGIVLHLKKGFVHTPRIVKHRGQEIRTADQWERIKRRGGRRRETA